jgi:hypothetical protein
VVAVAPPQVQQEKMVVQVAAQEINLMVHQPVAVQVLPDHQDKVLTVEVILLVDRVQVLAAAVAPVLQVETETTILVAMGAMEYNRQLVALRLTMQVVDME